MSNFRQAVLPPNMKFPDVRLTAPPKGLTGVQTFAFVGACMTYGFYKFAVANRAHNTELTDLQAERTCRVHMLERLYPSLFVGMAPFQVGADRAHSDTRTNRFLDAVEADQRAKRYDVIMGMRTDDCAEVAPYRITSTPEETRAAGEYAIPVESVLKKMEQIRSK